MIDQLDKFGDEEQLAKAAQLLFGDKPPAWLLGYFRRVIIEIDGWYAAGGGRIQRGDMKKALAKLQNQTQALLDGLNGWAGVFAEGEGNSQMIHDMRERLPALLEAIKAGQVKFSGNIKTGQGFASIAPNAKSPKVLFALGVYLAAEKLQKGHQNKLIFDVCKTLWQASRLSDPELNKIEEFAGVGPIPPGNAQTWDRPLQDAREIEPARDEFGKVRYAFFENQLMMGAENFAALFLISLQDDKIS